MQNLGFGRIHELEVRGGDPVFNPAPRIVQDIKLGSEESQHGKSSRDFVLKDQVIELFELLDLRRDCTVETIEIKHGLPFRLTLESPSGGVPA